MITNDVQYRSTKALHARFLEAIDNLTAQLASSQNKKLHQLQIDSARAQAGDLAKEVHEYEQLLSGATTTFTADSLSDLPLLLIRARVARGWSQRRLATELGIAEQQIQRYEANTYATASLTPSLRRSQRTRTPHPRNRRPHRPQPSRVDPDAVGATDIGGRLRTCWQRWTGIRCQARKSW